jgi:hypothetical protein
MQPPSKHSIVPIGLISQKIYFVRSTRVMLDADLARLYGVATKNLNKAVKRNASQFLSDFMFQLSSNEMRNLLRRKIAAMEKQYDARFQAVFATIRHMLENTRAREKTDRISRKTRAHPEACPNQWRKA